MTLTPEEQKELEELEIAFEHNGGRGVDDAERIDELRAKAGPRYAVVDVHPIDTWEEWLVEVPHGVDRAWIIANIEQLYADGKFVSLKDGGHYGFDDDVMVVELDE